MHPEIERIIVWLEEGAPSHLIKGDIISRRLLTRDNGRTIAGTLRDRLADLDFEHCMPPVEALKRTAQIVRGATSGSRNDESARNS